MNGTQPVAAKASPERRPARGFGALPCPKCNEVGMVSINLDNLDGDDACQCRECDETFSLSLIRDILDRWGKVVAWIDSAPVVEE